MTILYCPGLVKIVTTSLNKAVNLVGGKGKIFFIVSGLTLGVIPSKY